MGSFAFAYVGYYARSGTYDLVLPNIVSMGANAFNHNNKLKSVTLGTYGNNNLQTISNNAFRYIDNLTTINILEKPLYSLSTTAFSNGSSTGVMNVVWSEGEVSGAPWGFAGTINYNYVPAQ